MTVRAPLSFEAQAVADFNILRGLVSEILAADHDIPPGHLEHANDIAVSLARAAPALAGDVAMLVGLDQHQSAHAAVAEGLTTLRALDEYIFARSPSPRRLALLMTRILPNCGGWASALTNAELDDVHIKRRSWVQLCRRAVAEGKEHQIPSEADAALMPAAQPGHGGVSSSRSRVPLQAMKPEMDA